MVVSSIGLAAACLVAAPTQPGPVSVAYNGLLVCRMRVEAWGLSPYERACIVTRRLCRLISAALQAIADEQPVPVPEAARLQGQWVVAAADINLVTVTALDAAANGTQAAGLARVWAGRFARALARAAQYIGGKRSGGVARSRVYAFDNEGVRLALTVVCPAAETRRTAGQADGSRRLPAIASATHPRRTLGNSFHTASGARYMTW